MAQDDTAPMVVVTPGPDAPKEVGGTNVADALEVATGFIDLFHLAAHTFGVSEALSGLLTAYVNTSLRLMDIDSLRGSLQITIDRLPDMYAELQRRQQARLDKLN